MQKSKYISYPFIYFLLILFCLFFGILTFCLKEIYGGIFCFAVAILFAIPLIFLRKRFFLKMIIDETGIKTFYRNHLERELKWKDIIVVQAVPTAHGGQILLSDKPLFTGKERWKNWKEIFISFNSSFAIYLFKYKDKIPVEIIDLDKLHPVIQEKLKK